jgi:hypothetical protein
MLIACRAYSSTLNVEVVFFFETPDDFQRSTENATLSKARLVASLFAVT